MKNTEDPKKPRDKATELLAVAFDLLKPEPSKDGYTPIKGKDYFDGKDGYTPIKGVDYFDGKDGETPEIDYTKIVKEVVPKLKVEPGKDGYTPIKGVDYFDGKDGYTPIKGKDYFDGKDAELPNDEKIIEIVFPTIVKVVNQKVSSKTYSLSEMDDVDLSGLNQNSEGKYELGGDSQSFEVVSKNMRAYPASYTYTGDNLTSIEYDLGGGLTITKTLNYTGDNLTSVVLSGSTPSGIDLTKTLSYTGDNLTGIAYS